MRFYCFESHGSSRLGVGSSDGKQVLDLAAAAPELPKDPIEFVAGFASTQSIDREADHPIEAKLQLDLRFG
jgi:hypothetical protein